MFNLTDPPATTIILNGYEHDVDMSFDNILRLYDMLNDEELDGGTQIATGLLMLFGEIPKLPPEQLAILWEETFKQLLANDAVDEVEHDLLGNPMPSKNGNDDKPYYDFVQDAEYIYASFMQCYHMDLFNQHGRLHWYKFRAFVMGLHDDTIFKRIIGIRTMDLPKDAKDREEAIKLKKRYALKGEVIDDEFDDD